MKAYKGFDKDLKCRGFQYEIGKTYEEDSAKLCKKGFHACESPLDVFAYYPPTTSRYCEVELEDVDEKKGTDSKIVGKKITIGAEIGIPGLVKAHVEWVKEHLIDDDEHKSSNTGYYSSASNTGDCSSASNTGYCSSASNTGDCSSASNTGNRSSASNTGDRSSASNTGYCSSASNTGDYSSASNTGNRSSASNTGDCSSASNTGNYSSASNTGNRSSASNTGDYSSASNTGYCSSASNTGDCSSAEVSGRDSVAIACGRDSKAKASIGSAIVVVERDELGMLMGIKAAIVDGKRLKPDVFYTLKNGRIVKVVD